MHYRVIQPTVNYEGIDITTPIYDKSNPSSIEEFGQRLRGNTLRKKPGVGEITREDLDATEGVKSKGKFGTLMEVYYDIHPGNEACSPDFKDASVELKTNALNKIKKGFSAKERLSLGMIDYHEIIYESFETSCFMKKNKTLMLISRLYRENGVLVDAPIKFAQLIDFSELPPTDQEIIKEDWTSISNKITRGQAHLLSGSDTKYLEASTKGAVGANRVSQPNNDALARPRGFALKAGFVTSVVNRYLKGDLDFVEPDAPLAITDASEIEEKGFDAIIIERFNSFRKLNVEEIEARLDIKLNRSAKSYRASLALAMAKLITGSTTRKVAEFQRAGIVLKTILIDENGLPDQHMSFPAFRYMGDGSILTEDWDAVETDLEEEDGPQDGGDVPKFKQILEDRTFLFVVFKKEAETQVLDNVLFWSMPQEDIEQYVRPVWQQTFDCINTGTIDLLPKTSFNEVSHVRPHGANKADTFPTPHNGDQTKKSFWLDKRYIQSQIAKN